MSQHIPKSDVTVRPFCGSNSRVKGSPLSTRRSLQPRKKKPEAIISNKEQLGVCCVQECRVKAFNYSVSQGLGFPSKAPATKGWIMLQVNVPPLGAKMWKSAAAGKPKALGRHFLGVGISVLFLTPLRRDFCCGGDAVPLASHFPGSLQAVTCAVRSGAHFLASDFAIIGC